MSDNSALEDLLGEGHRVDGHRPWPRIDVGEDLWRRLGERLARGAWTMLDLWGEAGAVQMAVLDEEAGAIAVVSLACP